MRLKAKTDNFAVSSFVIDVEDTIVKKKYILSMAVLLSIPKLYVSLVELNPGKTR